MARSKSSKAWLKEHFNDVYVKKAHAEGYRSRAVYKLIEIQEKDRLIKPGMVIVDLGAAPGGWSQVASAWVKPRGKVIALDILPIDPIQDVKIIMGDFTSEAVYAALMAQLAEKQVDIVLSDMAPNMSGMPAVDQPKALYLAELALDFCQQVLKPKGSFVSKLFHGEGSENYLKQLRQVFQQVVIRKPEASRGRSSEVYVIGKMKK